MLDVKGLNATIRTSRASPARPSPQLTKIGKTPIRTGAIAYGLCGYISPRLTVYCTTCSYGYDQATTQPANLLKTLNPRLKRLTYKMYDKIQYILQYCKYKACEALCYGYYIL